MVVKKKIIAGAIAVAILAGSAVIVPKLLEEEPMTWTEYKEYVNILNREVKQYGKTIKLNQKEGESIREALESELLKRNIESEKGIIQINNKEYTADGYFARRNELFNKTK